MGKHLMQKSENVCITDSSSHQVSVENTSPLIKYIVEKMDQKVGKLPNASTCSRMVPEMRELSRMQLGHELLTAADTTVKYDGTSKKRRHFGEVQIKTKSKTFTIGVNEMFSGHAASYVKTIEESVQNLESCQMPGMKNKIFENISNTMTDRHVVNKSANTKLNAMCGHADENLNNFYCGMHPLDTFAKTADRVIKQWEQEAQGNEIFRCFKSCGSSNTYAVIQALCRLCFKDGAGLPSEIRTHLAMHGIKKNPLQPIMGNRFHISFLNAGASFFLQPIISDFFLTRCGATTKMNFTKPYKMTFS